MFEEAPPNLAKLLVHPPSLVSPGQEDEADQARSTTPERADVDPHAYVATPGKREDPWKGAERVLKKHTLIVSCGLLNFEESNLSNMKCQEFGQFYFDKYGERKPHSGFLDGPKQEKGAKQLFEKSFRINYPELCKDRNVIIVDCTRVKADPGDDMSLRGHTGRHWKTVEKLVDHKEFVEMNSPLQQLRLDKKNLVINVCVQGRHTVQLRTRSASSGC
jgi:hypothetical protein